MTKQKYHMNWMSIIGLCLLIAGTVITYLASVASDRSISSLQGEVGNLKDYSYYATLDIFGRQFIVNNGLSFHSDLSDRMSRLVVIKDGKVFVSNEAGLEPSIDSVVESYPYFPFGYWLKYNYLKAHGDLNWRIFATKAAEIFETTTSIKGHHPSHDEALRIAKQDLSAK